MNESKDIGGVSYIVVGSIAKNGDIELLKMIDFRSFSDNDIYNIIHEYKLSTKNETNTNQNECLKFLLTKLSKEYVRETNDSSICNYCRYYGGFSRAVLHKVKLNENGERIIMCETLKKVVSTMPL